MLNMSAENIRSIIERNYDADYRTWQNIRSTNCYAFALGLDVPEGKDYEWASLPGAIGHEFLRTPFDEYTCDSWKLHKQFLSDLKALEIYCEVFPEDRHLYTRFLRRQRGHSWDILLFTTGSKYGDFHFVRIGSDGNWYCKWGNHVPEPTSMEEVTQDGYIFAKKYRLSLDRGCGVNKR